MWLQDAFFFGLDVPSRAATLLHEAAHLANAPSHVTNGTQDKSFTARPAGAYVWTVSWLSWYASASVNAPEALRCAAWQDGNNVLAGKFVETPTFEIADPGFCTEPP